MGDRTAINLTSGDEMTVVDDASLLFPSGLPEPFDPERRWEWWTDQRVADEDDVFREARSWGFGWRGGESALRLSIHELASDECDDEGEDIEVRGTTGRLCRGLGVGDDVVAFDLRWEEDGQTIVIAYQSVETAPLTVDDILAIAEGLEPLG